MNPETLLAWGRAIARAWAFLSRLFQKRVSSEAPGAPTDRASSLPATPASPPRLEPRDYERRLRAEVLLPRYANVPDDPATAANERRTFCNLFTRAVCGWYGWMDFEAEDRDQAGEITRYMRAHPELWQPVTFVLAAELASRGHLVVAGQEQLVPPPTGHVCVIAPGAPIYSPKWGCQAPLAANVGGDNWYGKGLNFAFRKPPELFLYLGRPA